MDVNENVRFLMGRIIYKKLNEILIYRQSNFQVLEGASIFSEESKPRFWTTPAT